MKQRKPLIVRAIVLATVISLLVVAHANANPLTTSDLATGGLTAQALAQTLVGSGVTISNVTYTGANVAGGSFSGGDGIIGFNDGIILSSGNIVNTIGPNTSTNKSTANGSAGDTDLTSLAGGTTYDAAVLEFDFVPSAAKLYMRYVFSSEEYNEYVGSMFNDVFAFYVNGVNYAKVNGSAVTINTINNSTNPLYYIDNTTGALNTEMDGLTKVLSLKAPITPGQKNHMKLAIADTSDHIYDANVFIQADSLTAKPPTTSVGLSGKVKGNAVAFKGQLKDSSGQPIPYSKILFYKKVLKKGKKAAIGAKSKWTWKKVAQTTTDANGKYSKKLKVKQTTYFKAKFAGDDDDAAGSSKIIKVVVKKKK